MENKINWEENLNILVIDDKVMNVMEIKKEFKSLSLK